MPIHNVSKFFQRLIVNPPLTVFIFGLMWGLVAMTLARYWIVPTYLSSESGHILGDPLLYHNMALEQVRLIGEQGLSAFQLHYGTQGTAGVTSLLYLIYPSPMLVVILNALLLAIACAAVARLLLIWFRPAVALLATLPLLISPANIFWLAQINKEIYAMAGCALFFLGYTLALKHALAKQFRPLWLLLAIVGIFLIYIPRPHLNQMLMLGFAMASVLVIGALLLKKSYLATALVTIQAIVLSIMFGIFSQGGLSNNVDQLIAQSAEQDEISRQLELEEKNDAPSIDEGLVTNQSSTPNTTDSKPSQSITPEDAESKQDAKEVTNISDPNVPLGPKCYQKLDPANWQPADWLPESINSRFKALASLRCHNHELRDVHDNPTTKKSIADAEVSIEGTQDMIAYAPRALQLGFFGPLPSQWPAGSFMSSFFYTIVPVLMVFFYLGMIATVVWVIRSKAWLVLPIFVISMAPLWIYGMSTSFLGALFRYRYPFWIVLFSIGMAAMLSLLFLRKTGDRATPNKQNKL